MITVKYLKIRHNQGAVISFSETEHPRIPNTVLFDGKVVGTVRKSTIESFRKWLKNI